MKSVWTESLVRKVGKFALSLENPYIYTNTKTVLAVDFQVCPYMFLGPGKKGKKTVYQSSLCVGCYSANVLNIYGPLRNKIETAPPQTDERLSQFITDLETIKARFPEMKKLRFYALSDFTPGDIPYIIAASKIFTVDIISKTLTLPQNEIYLKGLRNVPNVWISLSFNSKIMNRFERVRNVIWQADNINLNYCLNVNEENIENFEEFQIIHMRNDKKLTAAKKVGLSLTRACGVYDYQGNLIEKGKCVACDNCHISYKKARVLNTEIIEEEKGYSLFGENPGFVYRKDPKTGKAIVSPSLLNIGV